MSDINDPSTNINWLTSIVMNLMLMVSILMTPKLVKMLISGGMSEIASTTQGAVMTAASLTNPALLAKTKAAMLFLPMKAGGFAKTQAMKGASKAWKESKKFARSAPNKIRSHFSHRQNSSDSSNVIRPKPDYWNNKKRT